MRPGLTQRRQVPSHLIDAVLPRALARLTRLAAGMQPRALVPGAGDSAVPAIPARDLPREEVDAGPAASGWDFSGQGRTGTAAAALHRGSSPAEGDAVLFNRSFHGGDHD
jgi:hypothetical protein